MKINSYTTLGRTGLRVSPLCLGTMTFGTDWGWGSEERDCKEMFEHFVGAGGNFIDTADSYTNGHSEEMVGRFTVTGNLRDKLVIATKFSFNTDPANPNAGGNGRKNIYRAVEGSLRRLNTDYIDLCYMHIWDLVTPVEEVLATLTDLVREGKIRYYGLSDSPAWYIARMQTLAEKEGKERVATIQHEYSLLERSIEREHIPAAQELGIGLCTWGPLSSGFLSGKYSRDGDSGKGEGRLTKPNQVFSRFTERNWQILEPFLEVANEMGKPPAQIALNWVVTQPGVTSTILGATRLGQLKDNILALEFDLPGPLRSRLDEASALCPVHPYKMFEPIIQDRVSGDIRGWQRTYP